MAMSSKPELLRHLINQFLDEQEALYNKMDYVSDIIFEMNDRDHIVFTYNSELQFKEIVNAYVRRGIDRNQINVLLIYTKEQQKFIESIDRVKNVNLILNSQDIMIIPADECFYDDGSFSAIPSLNRSQEVRGTGKTEVKKRVKCLGHIANQINRTGKIRGCSPT
jgi:MEDS: MEthanogen/methylotroph, DcmR Sensory domain